MTKAIVTSIPVDECICGEQYDPEQGVCFAKTHRTEFECPACEGSGRVRGSTAYKLAVCEGCSGRGIIKVRP